MSTIAVTNVKHPSAVDPAIVLDADGDVTYAGVHDFSAATVTGAPQGLVHIATESFSAVSSVSLNGVFTSAYDNYRVMINANLGSSSKLQMRWRVSGSDDSTGNYQAQFIIGRSNTASAEFTTTDTAAELVRANNSGSQIYSADIYSPNLSANTVIIGLSHNLFPENTSNRNYFNATTVFDGLTLFIASGTFTGTLRVYGYQNS